MESDIHLSQEGGHSSYKIGVFNKIILGQLS